MTNEPQTQPSGVIPPIPPTVDTKPSEDDGPWWMDFDMSSMVEVRNAFHAILEEHNDRPTECIVAVRIPYDVFHGMLQEVHELSFEEGHECLDRLGMAMADMYYFDDNIPGDKTTGVAASYFTEMDEDGEPDDDEGDLV